MAQIPRDRRSSTSLPYRRSSYYTFWDSQLKQVDGTALDRGALWRAGANTYRGRADLVVPFLLQTTRTSFLPFRGVSTIASSWTKLTDNSHTAENTNEEKTSRKGTDRVECPWCGLRAAVGEGAVDGGVTDAEPGGDSGRGRASDRYGVVGDIGRSQLKLSQGHDRDSMLRKTCDSCGFLLPDTSLWAVPGSTSARIPARWDDVLAAGHRWRTLDNADVVNAGYLEIENRETAAGSVFRESCLRGRDERARMRCRHRREERDLESSADLEGAAPTTNGGRDSSTVRSTSLAPSKRRLELELVLGERHTRERENLASQQLYLHGKGGTGDTEGRNIDQETCMVLDVRQPAEGDAAQEKTRSIQDISRSNAPETAAACRRNGAARNMQRLWGRYRKRRTRSMGSPRGMNTTITGPADEKAVTKLQSAFRGFHVRRALQVKRRGNLPSRTCPRIEQTTTRRTK